MGVGQPNDRVSVKLFVRKEPSVKLTGKEEKGVQHVGRNGQRDLTEVSAAKHKAKKHNDLKD